MWKFFKGIVFHILPVFVVASLVIMLIFPEIPPFLDFMQHAAVLTVVIYAVIGFVYYVYSEIKDTIQDKSKYEIDILDSEEVMIQNAINPDHPSLRPIKKAFKQAHVDGLEKENKKLTENTNDKENNQH